MRPSKIIGLLLIVLFFNTAFSAENDVESKTSLEIISLLQKWSQDFNAKNVQEVCGLFAPDLIASYPGTPDRNYKDMCHHFNDSLKDPDKIFTYESPQILQILIDHDLIVVRLIWTLNISYKNRSNVEIIKEKGLDVFRRQKDGSLKIAISYAYPIVNL